MEASEKLKQLERSSIESDVASDNAGFNAESDAAWYRFGTQSRWSQRGGIFLGPKVAGGAIFSKR
jgi:hypothetical protein